MLSFKQLQTLYELLNSKQENLDKYNERLVKHFGAQSYNLFRPCHTMSNMLNLNLLTKSQRLICIFLLIESFKTEGIRKNPFGMIIIEVYEKTSEPYERKMVCELLLDNKRDRVRCQLPQYAKLKMQILIEEQQLYLETYKNRDEMDTIKKAFIEQAPKLSATKQSQIRNIVLDFNYKDRKPYPLDAPVTKQSLKQGELSADGFGTHFLRPLPAFIDINANQLVWVSPGIIHDVVWDNTFEKQKKIMRTKQFLKKAETTPLKSQEARQVMKTLEEYPNYNFQNDVSPSGICEMVIKNPFIAPDLLVKLAKSPRFKEYIEMLIQIKLHINSLDVMARFIEKCDITRPLVNYYVIRTMEKCMEQSQSNQQKFARIIATFIKTMIKNNQINPKDIDNYVKQFLITFPKVLEVQHLNKIILDYQNNKE